MPRTNAPPMIQIKFSVPANLLQELIRLAESEGWKESELHRIVWVLGLSDYFERLNKRLVGKGLLDKQDKSRIKED